MIKSIKLFFTSLFENIGSKIFAGAVYLLVYGFIGTVLYFFITLGLELLGSVPNLLTIIAAFLFASFILGSFLFKKWG